MASRGVSEGSRCLRNPDCGLRKSEARTRRTTDGVGSRVRPSEHASCCRPCVDWTRLRHNGVCCATRHGRAREVLERVAPHFVDSVPETVGETFTASMRPDACEVPTATNALKRCRIPRRASERDRPDSLGPRIAWRARVASGKPHSTQRSSPKRFRHPSRRP